MSETTDRGVSTVLDVSLGLLLMSAAIGVVVTQTTPTPPPDRAADTATLLGTATESITYTPGPEGATYNHSRHDHGTVARLLASAAITNASIDGQPVAPAGSYERAVTSATKNILAGVDGQVAVTARWAPVEDGPIAGRIRVGPSPPPDVDVHAARVVVAIDTQDWQTHHPNHTRAVAQATVDAMFPPTRVAPARVSPGEDRRVINARYRAASEAFGVDPARPTNATSATWANRYLAIGLADRLADTNVTVSNRTTAPTTVEVVVYTWQS
ncbi:MAG: hypothetical protein ACLFSD_00300 [Salinivenus sp.]